MEWGDNHAIGSTKSYLVRRESSSCYAPPMRTFLLLAMVTLAACHCHSNQPESARTPAASQPAGAPARTKAAAREPLPASIGSATMKEDGTIVLQLRAEGPGGVRGDALITYKRGDKRHGKVLEHLGGLEPGQTKPVPPWPEK